MLRRRRFLTGRLDPQCRCKDVTWISPAGVEMQVADWQAGHSDCFGMLIDGRAGGGTRPVADVTLLILLNADPEAVAFKLPVYAGGRVWICLLNTTQSEHSAPQSYAAGEAYPLSGRSLLLLASRI
jgi:glycogen operon protein